MLQQQQLQQQLQDRIAPLAPLSLLSNTHNIQLNSASRRRLLAECCDIIKEPRGKSKLKVFARRSPSQEEYFSKSLKNNPIAVSSIQVLDAGANAAAAAAAAAAQNENSASSSTPDAHAHDNDDGDEPTMGDLRATIAKGLDMADSKELFELLVGGKIVDVKLKVRVVAQVLWKKYVIESSEENGGISPSDYERIDVARFPPMVVTYRFAGLDGEATEDIVDSLEDPEKKLGNDDEEKKMSITTVFAENNGYGLKIILEEVSSYVQEELRAARRDEDFPRLNTDPGPALTLLKFTTAVKSNREHLCKIRGPGTLLKTLLQVMRGGVREGEKKNATFDLILSIIEQLSVEASSNSSENAEDEEADGHIDVLFEALAEQRVVDLLTSKSSLVNVVGRLIPSLIYGSEKNAASIAERFSVVKWTNGKPPSVTHSVLVESTTITNSFLSSALLNSGFVDSTLEAILAKLPSVAPPVQALHDSESKFLSGDKKKSIELEWNFFLEQAFLKDALRSLTGLTRGCSKVALIISKKLLKCLHWLEETSSSGEIGLMCESLLEAMGVADGAVSDLVKTERAKTKARKREIAKKRREQALAKMAKSSTSLSMSPIAPTTTTTMPAGAVLTPTETTPSASSATTDKQAANKSTPSWMKELENMEEEEGIVCVVCGEGDACKPTEAMSEYAHLSKVVETDIAGTEGLSLFTNLPSSISAESIIPAYKNDEPSPAKKVKKNDAKEKTNDDKEKEGYTFLYLQTLIQDSKDAVAAAKARSSSSRRTTVLFTSTSASNAIHVGCHKKAREADRSHPKAPKSEWEGATLRNTRVSCNALLPLESTTVSLSEYSRAEELFWSHVSASIGISPGRTSSKTFLLLHNTRFLMKAMSAGDNLASLSGGGILASNATHLLNLIKLCKATTKTALVSDSPGEATRAYSLPAAFVVNALIQEGGEATPSRESTLFKSVHLSIICSILYKPIVWKNNRAIFLRWLIRASCMQPEGGGSGSGSGSGSGNGSRSRANSFAEWCSGGVEEVDDDAAWGGGTHTGVGIKRKGESARALTAPRLAALRRNLIFFAMSDLMSKEMDVGEESGAKKNAVGNEAAEDGERLRTFVDGLWQKKNIEELKPLIGDGAFEAVFDSENV